jgi:hypothetical protein
MVNREYANWGGNDPGPRVQRQERLATSEAGPDDGPARALGVLGLVVLLIPRDAVDKQPHKPIRV